MASQSELLSYSTQRRGLRTSQPTGEQRSTYRLQLPYRFSLPLLGGSILLHWLSSESLFLVRLKTYSLDGKLDPSQLISTVIYSASAIVASLGVSSFMLIVLLMLSLVMVYPPIMPLAANCSASLAAITRPPPGSVFEQDMATKKVGWGLVGQGVSSSDAEDGYGIRHATFSCGEGKTLKEQISTMRDLQIRL